MLNYLYRLRAKKAFTMVELLVVIAIIGILLALIIPNMLNSDKPTKAKGYAKAYFYAVQDFMGKMRISEDPDVPYLDDALSMFCLYTRVDDTGNVTDSGVVSHLSNKMTDNATYQGSGAEPQLKTFVNKFSQAMEKAVPTTEYEGVFYVVVDTSYRVEAAYWSDGTIEQIAAGNDKLKFDDNHQISGYTCAAFPVEFSTLEGSSAAGRRMFYI